MTSTISSLQTDIDELTRRHALIKQKWIEKKQLISETLKVTNLTSNFNANKTPSPESQYSIEAEAENSSEFDQRLFDFLHLHTPVSVITLSKIFNKDPEEIQRRLKDSNGKYLISFDPDRQMVISTEPVRLFLEKKCSFI